jgi:hypothetical protein
MDPRVSAWPEDDEEPSDTAKLIREIDREIAADLRAAGEPSPWDEVATVFDEEANRVSPREEVVERKHSSCGGSDRQRCLGPGHYTLRGCAPTSPHWGTT